MDGGVKALKLAEFEEKFAKMVGHKYAVAVTSNSHFRLSIKGNGIW